MAISRIRKAAVIFVTAVLILMMSIPLDAAYAQTNVKEPAVTAAAAIVYCENTGETVYTKNADKVHYPYSITKLMTALLVVQNLPLDREVTVSAKAASMGGSTMNLQAGEKATVEQLLYGTLVLSGNDAAYALGEAVSGNAGTFVALMNKTAANLGCSNTHFVNPTGIKNKNHYTTARDYLQILRVALSNSTIRKIAGTKVYKMPATNMHKARTMKTHLDLLTTRGSGIYGGKTGYWSDYDCTIAVGYKKNGLHLYIVLLGDTMKQRKVDLKLLTEYAAKKVEGVRVVGAGKEIGKVRINHGAKTRLEAYTSETGYAYLPKEGSKSLIKTKTVMKSDVKAPVKKGDVVGYYKIYVSDDLVNEVPLVVKENVETGWFPSYLGISNFATIIICIILILILALLLIIMSLRIRHRRIMKKRRQLKIMRMAEEEMRREAEHNERDWRF